MKKVNIFEKAELQQQKLNYEINEKYWAKKLHSLDAPLNDVLEVFNSRKEHVSYYKRVEKRIASFAKTNFINRDEVIYNIVTNRVIRNQVAPKASRQCIQERIQNDKILNAVKRLRKELNINIEINDNTRHIVINNNGIIKHSLKRNTATESKSFDYGMTITKNNKKYTIYFINKYTKTRGGSQDNVKVEMYNTHNYCLNNKDKQTFFYFLLDGEYWVNNGKKIYTDNKKFMRSNVSNVYKTLKQFILNL